MEECGARHDKLGVQPVRSAGARHSGARGQCGTSVSQIAMVIMVYYADLHEMEIAIRGVNTETPLQPGDTLLQPVSNDTYPTTPPRERHLSNTATKGL